MYVYYRRKNEAEGRNVDVKKAFALGIETALPTILVLSLLMMCITNMISISQQQEQTTRISIIPSQIEVGDENVQIGKINKTYWKTTEPFNVTINVSNVVDLYAWQVRIFYYPLIVNGTRGVYPTGHVFDGKRFVENIDFTNVIFNMTVKATAEVNPQNPLGSMWRDPKFPARVYNLTEWIDEDNSGSLSKFDAVRLVYGDSSLVYFVQKLIFLPTKDVQMTVLTGYIQWAASLLGEEATFTGNGTLCQIEFEGTYPGSSPLNFMLTDTYLLNSNITQIPFDVNNAVVTVKGIPIKDKSKITLDVFPNEVKLGGNVTLYGEIVPSIPNVNVTIIYRKDGEWNVLKEIETDITGHFEYIWIPNETGTFHLKVSWKGDKYTEGATSEEKEVRVTVEEPTGGEGQDITLYIAMGIIIVVIIVIVTVYFKKFKS
jgi:hypothetical protein